MTRRNFEPYYAQTLEFYERLASLYDFLYPDHLGYSEHLFERLAPILKSLNVFHVLDASCGVGHDMLNMFRLGFRVDGMDISQHMMAAADRRLRQAGYSDFELRVGDVRHFQSTSPNGAYDLVVFRGNTLSNIHPRDLAAAVRQLISVVRPGGLLLLDYRDGKRQIAERKRVEFRGWGIERASKTLFCSYYVLRHSMDIDEPYDVNATIHRADLGRGYCVDNLHIRSHYVDGHRLLNVLHREALREIEIRAISGGGLPYLQTLLMQRSS